MPKMGCLPHILPPLLLLPQSTLPTIPNVHAQSMVACILDITQSAADTLIAAKVAQANMVN